MVTVPAQVLVDKNDPALADPTKPIGQFYSEEQAENLRREKGWILRNDSNRGYRRYVASPYPIDIIEKDAIKLLLDSGYIVVTCGGGGIPVRYEEDGTLSLQVAKGAVFSYYEFPWPADEVQVRPGVCR